MSKPENLGSTVPSSEATRFETHTASIPDVITGADPEILPPGAAPPIETGWPIDSVQQIAALPFFLLKKRYGEIWEIDDEETRAIAKAWKPILDRYFPDDSEWEAAAIVTLAIAGPRLAMTDWSKGKKGKDEKEKPTPPASTKTAASGASPSSSANESRENLPEWDLLRDK